MSRGSKRCFRWATEEELIRWRRVSSPAGSFIAHCRAVVCTRNGASTAGRCRHGCRNSAISVQDHRRHGATTASHGMPTIRVVSNEAMRDRPNSRRLGLRAAASQDSASWSAKAGSHRSQRARDPAIVSASQPARVLLHVPANENWLHIERLSGGHCPSVQEGEGLCMDAPTASSYEGNRSSIKVWIGGRSGFFGSRHCGRNPDLRRT